MIQNEILLETETLENGVELNLYDASRKVAGERWQVVLIVRARVPVTEALCRQCRPADTEEIRALLGESQLWEQKRERNFIDEKEKEAVLAAMRESFSGTIRSYVAHPEFAVRLIARRCQDLAKRQRQGII
ncbi:MAG: hypothetical protein ACLFPD_04455 [Desulfosudaceae bacterium]